MDRADNLEFYEETERALPEITSAHNAWWEATHNVLSRGNPRELRQLREMAEKMRADVGLLERQIGAIADKLKGAPGDEE